MSDVSGRRGFLAALAGLPFVGSLGKAFGRIPGVRRFRFPEEYKLHRMPKADVYAAPDGRVVVSIDPLACLVEWVRNPQILFDALATGTREAEMIPVDVRMDRASFHWRGLEELTEDQRIVLKIVVSTIFGPRDFGTGDGIPVELHQKIEEILYSFGRGEPLNYNKVSDEEFWALRRSIEKWRVSRVNS